MYNDKVMFSLFPSPSGRNQMFNQVKSTDKIIVLCMLVVVVLDGDLPETRRCT